MTDPIARLRSAQRQRDLLGTAEAVLQINGPQSHHRVGNALRSLHPYLDEATRAVAAPFTLEEPSRDYTPHVDEFSTVPMDLVAWLSAEDRKRSWELLIQMGPRALIKAVAMVDVPLDLIPELLPVLFAVSGTLAPELGPFDETLCRYHSANADATKAWFLLWIGTTGHLVPKIASAPAWTAAVHSPEELADLVRLIIAHRRP